MEITEEFNQLVANLNKLTDGVDLKENKEEIHAILERMGELLDEIGNDNEIDEDE